MNQHLNPLVSFHLWDTGEVVVTNTLQFGGEHAYVFDDPDYLMGISRMFAQAAEMLDDLLSGEKDIEELSDDVGGEYVEDFNIDDLLGE